MQNRESRVSVVMPVRNGEEFLSDAVADIKKNIDSIDEIIVINDGSVDRTEIILKEWRKRDSRVNIINTNGVGIVKSLNLGINEAQNNLIARFDVDDRYSPTRISVQRKAFERDTAAVFTDYAIISETNKYLGTIPTALFNNQTAISLVKSQRTPHPSAMLNKEAFLDVGGYLVDDFPAEDLSLWLRMSKSYKLKGVPNVSLRYRLNKKSITHQNRSLAIKKKDFVLEKYQISKTSIKNCMESWSETMKSYEETSLGAERKILLFQDLLIAVNKYGGITEQGQLKDIQRRLIKDFMLLPNILGLSYFKLLRNITRFYYSIQ